MSGLAIEDLSFQQKDEHSRINTWKNVKGGQDGGRETINKEAFLPPPLQICFETRQNNYVVLNSAVKIPGQHILPKQCT